MPPVWENAREQFSSADTCMIHSADFFKVGPTSLYSLLLFSILSLLSSSIRSHRRKRCDPSSDGWPAQAASGGAVVLARAGPSGGVVVLARSRAECQRTSGAPEQRRARPHARKLKLYHSQKVDSPKHHSTFRIRFYATLNRGVSPKYHFLTILPFLTFLLTKMPLVKSI